MKYFVYWCFISFATFLQSYETDLDVYIFGGRGDLAKRYLWNGFFRLYQENVDASIMRFYGLGLSYVQQSDFKNMIVNSIRCDTNYAKNCKENMQKFLSKTSYLQMNTEIDYKKLGQLVNTSENDAIFYLSVPPSAYKHIIESISSRCELTSSNRSYKFVFEKPFGESLESARVLSKMLSEHLDESQIFRVDHYLGKETSHKIMNFRKKNPEIERIMNRDYVEKIEIVVSETIGCKGRTRYYDRSGVIRDMLQSHLTEILCLVTKDITGDENKLNLLRSISTIEQRDVILGQYQGYTGEVFNETGKNNSLTPTFASVKMNIKSLRWKNVPIKLISGKHLNERSGYGRIVFRRKHFQGSSQCESASPQIIFVIRDEKLESPAILVSRELPFNSEYIPKSWILVTQFDDSTIFGVKGKCLRILIPRDKMNAYTYLISKIYKGDHEHFVPTHDLLESWRIWSPIATDPLKNYTGIIQYNVGWTISRILYYGVCEPHKCCIFNIFQSKCDRDH